MNYSTRHLPILSVLVCLLLSGCGEDFGSAAGGGGSRESVLDLTPCQLSIPGRALRIPAECGELEVAEDPSRPAGRRISLSVAVLRAVRRDAAPDPLFLLAGGPGQAATEAFLPLLGALRNVRQERDLILVDQRGTGASNPLDCELGPEGDLETLSDEEEKELLSACLESWEADPRFYHSQIAMMDLNAVREALGYETINLYGVSYGTRAALTYLRMFEERVRSVILDGVVPQDLVLGIDWAREAQRSIDLIFRRCRESTPCQDAFPDLEGSFEALLTSLEEAPVTLEIDHPESGRRISLEVDRETIAVLVQRLSYAPETVALLPLLIHEAAHEGRLEALASQALTTGSAFGGMSVGMTLSVLCAEDERFMDAEAAAAASEGYYLGDYQPRMLRRLCSFWPRGEVEAAFKAPVESSVPALLLSGEADPVTPPTYGDRVAAGFAHSLHLVAPGLGHNVLARGCIPRLVEEFLESGSVEGLDGSCVEDIEPTAFFVSPAGPSP